MFGFLSFILFFVFIILIIGLSLLAKIIGTVIKAGKRMTGTDRTSAYEKPQDYTDSDTGYTETTVRKLPPEIIQRSTEEDFR